MAIKASSPETVEQAQEMLRAAVRPPQTFLKNTALAANPTSDSYFEFHGTSYKAPPLGYKQGLQLQEIYFEIHRLKLVEEAEGFYEQEDKSDYLRQLLACYEKATSLFHTNCKPLAFWKRWRHKKTNPFVDCSGEEIGELLSFFSLCRTKSRVRLAGGLAFRPSLSTLTPSTTSPTSLATSQPG